MSDIKQKINFIWIRLKNASVLEIVFRIKTLFTVLKLRIMFYGNKTIVPGFFSDKINIGNLVVPPLHRDSRYKCYAADYYDFQTISQQIWNQKFKPDFYFKKISPKSHISDQSRNNDGNKKILFFFGCGADRIFFSDVKTDNIPIDIRIVWEPARLQQVMEFIAFYTEKSCLNSSIKMEQASIEHMVFQWIDYNEFLCGPHYISSMECGLRVMVFFYCLCFFRNFSGRKNEIMARAIFEHTWWIYKRLSLYSSLGNHTICECIGLIFGGAAFIKTKQGREWLETGCNLLDQEISHQILSDGGPGEQSFGYHRFVLDLYWLATGFLESNHLYDCSAWKSRLITGEEFLHDFMFDGEHFPMFGDSDDGYAVAPGVYPERYTVKKGKTLQSTKISYRTFHEAGYTAIWSTDGVFITFDHGPLGMAPLYNHGHADALSVTLYRNGKPFFVDMGTYRYNGVPEYRKYFKGTRAHNTVCIDGKDQARQVTGFIWDKPYGIAMENIRQRYPGTLCFRACHNGYKRLENSVIHNRELTVYDRTCCIIVDSFTGTGEHGFELNFHIDPGVKVERNSQWICLDNSGESIFVYDADNSFSCINGCFDPLLGWYSPSYGAIQKTNVLHKTANGFAGAIRFVTLICFNASRLEDAVDVRDELMEIQ